LFAVIFSEDVFRIVLGERWLQAAPIFAWLGACSLTQVATSSTGWLYLSQGRGKEFFNIGLFNSITTVISFIVGLPWGALGVAISYCLSDYVIRLPLTWWVTCRKGPVSVADIVSLAMPHLFACAAAAGALLLARWKMHQLSGSELAALLAASYGVYLVAILPWSAKRKTIQAGLASGFSMLNWVRPSRASGSDPD
jgi:PST family polysaccharide transporter